MTCGIWTFSGTCPVLKKLLLLFIYWTLSFSLNFSTLRDLQRGSRTWAGEAKKSQITCVVWCSSFFVPTPTTLRWFLKSLFAPFDLNFINSLCHRFLIWINCWLCFSQRWCPTKPDHCSALSPRSWGSDASTERGTHPWTVSSWI